MFNFNNFLSILVLIPNELNILSYPSLVFWVVTHDLERMGDRDRFIPVVCNIEA